jgi:hypothetical protein
VRDSRAGDTESIHGFATEIWKNLDLGTNCGALASNVTANGMTNKRIDLDQLTPPKLTAHFCDSLRRILMMGNEIAMLHDARPTDSVSVSLF